MAEADGRVVRDWLGLGLTFGGMLLLGAITWGETHNEVTIQGKAIDGLVVGLQALTVIPTVVAANTKNIERVEAKFDSEFDGYNRTFNESRGASQEDRRNLWTAVHAHDLMLQQVQSSVTAIDELRKQVLASADRRDLQFEENRKSNEQQLIQLHDIAGRMDVVAGAMQQVVSCLNQVDGCKHLGMPFAAPR